MSRRHPNCAAESFAEVIGATVTRGVIVLVPPSCFNPIGLKKNGGSIDWCYRKRSEMSPEEKEMKVFSERLRHELKIHRAREQKEFLANAVIR